MSFCWIVVFVVTVSAFAVPAKEIRAMAAAVIVRYLVFILILLFGNVPG
jgi:hypothetical protein